MVNKELRQELQQPNPDLARATGLLARGIAYPRLDIDALLAVVDTLAADAGAALEAVPAAQRGEQLMALLFGSGRFRGNEADYANPRNSFINDVLHSGLGIPISLAALYLMVASRLGIQAGGIGLPGHFIVAVTAAGERQLYDPFHGGRQLSTAACTALVRRTTGYQGPLREEWLAPVPAGELIARMLRNLRTVYLQAGQWGAVQCVLEHLILVEPRVPIHMRDLGMVMLQRRQTERGIYYLEAYLRAAPDASDRDDLRAAMADHLARVGRLN